MQENRQSARPLLRERNVALCLRECTQSIILQRRQNIELTWCSAVVATDLFNWIAIHSIIAAASQHQHRPPLHLIGVSCAALPYQVERFVTVRGFCEVKLFSAWRLGAFFCFFYLCKHLSWEDRLCWISEPERQWVVLLMSQVNVLKQGHVLQRP